MNIEDMIYNGASEEEIMDAIAKIQKEKAELDRKAKEHEEATKRAIEKEDRKEALKAEGRAYLINALIAYSSAFGLSDEDWDDEDIAKAEELIKRIEDMIPMYIKLAEMQERFDSDFFKGLF